MSLMKLPENWKRSNGLELYKVSMDGFCIETRKVKVNYGPHLSPGPGCDCIIDMNSVNSDDVFEVHEKCIIDIYNYRPIGYTYCLPKNLDFVKMFIKNEINQAADIFITNQQVHIQQLEQNINEFNETYPNPNPT